MVVSNTYTVPVTLSWRQRLTFVTRYVLNKTLLLHRDVRSPRLRMLVYEAVYSICRLLGLRPLRMAFLDITRIDSVFGTFHLRPGTIDAACASPAFERPDIDALLAEFDRAVRTRSAVVFVDIGAGLGTYSVTVGNHLRDRPARILAFEPSSSSAALLRRNISTNGLDDVVDVRQRALADGSVTTAILNFDVDEPGSSGLDSSAVAVRNGHVVKERVPVSTLDAELADVAELDLLVLKIDVEGLECVVLRGARDSVARAAETMLLVEDFVDPRVIDHLHADGWLPMMKVTPYNSFWRRLRTTGDTKTAEVGTAIG
ncbi:methyltransferase, FkbM family [Lentzea xinjiangensis]|uniref:Methyltransferase, FkbM family n=1 Tax=Lentzea xinjiangensis TaxID=402600 RepID=A0A1H9VZW3_9PSEU|nr:FkbM family methyltransferase [Lentzea xinjiangensis]SES27260.1 methyltransferase, FkbM family [Lentzea xinjiangensis]